jgi:hypothetical protein
MSGGSFFCGLVFFFTKLVSGFDDQIVPVDKFRCVPLNDIVEGWRLNGVDRYEPC